MNRIKLRTAAVLIVLAAIANSAFTQDQSQPSLQDQLQTMYKVSRAGVDSGGFKILEAGTVVVLKKTGIMATEPPGAHKFMIKLPKACDNTFKNGNLSVSRTCSTTTIGSRFLNQGEKMYITKFEVNQKSDKVTFDLVECDQCNGASKPSSMKAIVVFDFANKFLDTAEPGQVVDVINQVFQPQH
ncbi:hypothetical protein ACFPT7_23100 [Acidicapsa dinghuensis]|uniref:Uncharacterized protein n=1 Tax=Acidicapsa dinghuensis TaxID=2218256 RepID=A0ABW1EPK9_9BACT|nr:hypothetical protein [Acidicapsa dinghuensis]